MNQDKQPWRERLKGATWESNLLVGGVLVVLGATEVATLVGTESSALLLYVGIGLLLWGTGQWLLKK